MKFVRASAFSPSFAYAIGESVVATIVVAAEAPDAANTDGNQAATNARGAAQAADADIADSYAATAATDSAVFVANCSELSLVD